MTSPCIELVFFLYTVEEAQWGVDCSSERFVMLRLLFEVSMNIAKHVWRNWAKTWMFWGPLVWFACLVVNPPVTIMLSYVAICVVIVVMGVKGMMVALNEDE